MRRRRAKLPPIARPWPALVLGVDPAATSGAALLAHDGVLWARQVRRGPELAAAVADAVSAAAERELPLAVALEHWSNHGRFGGARTQRGLGAAQGRWLHALELHGLHRRVVRVEPTEWYRLVVGGRKRRDDKETVCVAMRRRFGAAAEGLGPDAAEALAIAEWGLYAGALGMVLPARVIRAHLADDPGLLDELERRRGLARTASQRETRR